MCSAEGGDAFANAVCTSTRPGSRGDGYPCRASTELVDSNALRLWAAVDPTSATHLTGGR